MCNAEPAEAPFHTPDCSSPSQALPGQWQRSARCHRRRPRPLASCVASMAGVPPASPTRAQKEILICSALPLYVSCKEQQQTPPCILGGPDLDWRDLQGRQQCHIIDRLPRCSPMVPYGGNLRFLLIEALHGASSIVRRAYGRCMQWTSHRAMPIGQMVIVKVSLLTKCTPGVQQFQMDWAGRRPKSPVLAVDC